MKKIIVVTFLIIFASSNVQSAENCKQYKKLSKNYIKCISGKLSLKNKSNNLSLDTSNIKEKKTLSDWFKKKK
tara:strand:+ start:916 stop:1134 length:219 start_codon:yes stop_codon:yes gene_type:complete